MLSARATILQEPVQKFAAAIAFIVSVESVVFVLLGESRSL
jgi:hypothetical protein